MSYKVYRVSSTGMPRDHQAIFVETQEDLTGHKYHVTVNIQTGMAFEEKLGEDGEKAATYQSETQIGKVKVENLSRIKEICLSIASLKKQFQGPRRLYPQEPLRRCQEWTAEVVRALVAEKVIYQEDEEE